MVWVGISLNDKTFLANQGGEEDSLTERMGLGIEKAK